MFRPFFAKQFLPQRANERERILIVPLSLSLLLFLLAHLRDEYQANDKVTALFSVR